MRLGFARAAWRASIFAIAAVVLAAAGACPARGEIRTLELSAGVHRIEAEVASTFAERAEGLMHRHKMAANRGMLFVFPQRAQHCMWMRNTLIPLSVAFLDDAGEIINIAEMQPETEVNHCAAKPARFALEMNAGWFKRRGIGAGQRVAGIERAPAPR